MVLVLVLSETVLVIEINHFAPNPTMRLPRYMFDNKPCLASEFRSARPTGFNTYKKN